MNFHPIIIRCVLYACLLNVPQSQAHSAPDETFQLVGTVERTNGSAKQGVAVSFEPGGYFTITDRNGRFVVGKIHPGYYIVTLRQGSKFQNFNIEIKENSPVHFEVTW